MSSSPVAWRAPSSAMDSMLATPTSGDLLASPPMAEQIYTGNAVDDGSQYRDWVLGHFMPVDDPRHSDAVEIKWAVHQRGDKRANWVTGERRTAAIFLIDGRFRVELPGRSVVLERRGDYIVFAGVGHSWVAEDDST